MKRAEQKPGLIRAFLYNDVCEFGCPHCRSPFASFHYRHTPEQTSDYAGSAGLWLCWSCDHWIIVVQKSAIGLLSPIAVGLNDDSYRPKIRRHPARLVRRVETFAKVTPP